MDAQTKPTFSEVLLAVSGLDKEVKDTIFSPFGLEFCLAMALPGLSGESRKEMLQLLGIEESDADTFLENLAERYRSLVAMQKTQIALVNLLWHDHRIIPQPDFRNFTEPQYDLKIKARSPEAMSGGFVQAELNNEINLATNGFIKEMPLPKVSLSEEEFAGFLLVNILWAKGKWRTRFKDHPLGKDFFRLPNGEEKMIPFMVREETKWGTDIRYHKADFFHAISIPCEDLRIVMEVYLPFAAEDISKMVDRIPEICQQNRSWEFLEIPGIDVKIPGFEFNSDVSFSNQLAGIFPHIFNSSLDWEPMFESSWPVRIAEITQKVKVRVDKEGFEAAAVTMLFGAVGAGMVEYKEPVVFHCHHPFLFNIRDNETNTSLFTGCFSGQNPNFVDPDLSLARERHIQGIEDFLYPPYGILFHLLLVRNFLKFGETSGWGLSLIYEKLIQTMAAEGDAEKVEELEKFWEAFRMGYQLENPKFERNRSYSIQDKNGVEHEFEIKNAGEHLLLHYSREYYRNLLYPHRFSGFGAWELTHSVGELERLGIPIPTPEQNYPGWIFFSVFPENVTDKVQFLADWLDNCSWDDYRPPEAIFDELEYDREISRKVSGYHINLSLRAKTALTLGLAEMALQKVGVKEGFLDKVVEMGWKTLNGELPDLKWKLYSKLMKSFLNYEFAEANSLIKEPEKKLLADWSHEKEIGKAIEILVSSIYMANNLGPYLIDHWVHNDAQSTVRVRWEIALDSIFRLELPLPEPDIFLQNHTFDPENPVGEFIQREEIIAAGLNLP